METRYPDEFRRDAVRTATAIGLTRPQAASDLAVGLSTLNMWVQKHPHDDPMAGPDEDVEKKCPPAQEISTSTRGEGRVKMATMH